MKEAAAREIFDHCKASASFENGKHVLSALLEKYRALPNESTGNAGDAETVKTRIAAERLVEIREISGNTSLNYNVEWASLSADEYKTFDSVCFHRVSMGLRSLCNDDIAKDAMKKISTIHIKSGGPPSATVAGATLELVGKWSDLSQSPSDGVIRIALDEGLRVTYHRMLRRLVQEQLPTREKGKNKTKQRKCTCAALTCVCRDLDRVWRQGGSQARLRYIHHAYEPRVS